MNTKNIISTTEARKNLFKIVEGVSSPDTQYILTDRGKAKAVIMSVDEFEGWKETIELLSMYPNLPQELKEARKEIEEGEYITLEEFDKKYIK